MGILFSQSGFTQAAVRHASLSQTPLLLVHLPGGHPSDQVASITEALDDADGEPMAVSDAEAEEDGHVSDLASVTESGSSLVDGDEEGCHSLRGPANGDSSASTLASTSTSASDPTSDSDAADPSPCGIYDYGPPPLVDVGAMWWNAPLSRLMPKNVELRRELSPTTGTARVGVWYFGGRMGRYGPIEE
jgi:hypothetical protein